MVGEEAGPVVLEDVVVVVGEDGEGVAQHQARPHHYVARPPTQALLQPLGDEDQRDLAHHAQQRPGLGSLRLGERGDYQTHLEHPERHAQQILVEDGRHGEHGDHGELLREAAPQEGLVEVS